MKKIIVFLCSLVLFSSSLFSKNFFEKRYFEIVLDVPANLANNSFSINDVFQKELVIDFTKIANEMTPSGLNLIAKANPNIAINLNLPLFSLGFQLGIDVFGKVGIGKGLFDVLGYGYQAGDTIDIPFEIDGDVFVTAGIKTGFDVGFFAIEVNPSIFAPLIHFTQDGSQISITNSTNGDIAVNAQSKINIYTPTDISGFDVSSYGLISDYFGSSLGFDIAGAVHFRYFDNFDIWGATRIPIYPGHLTYSGSINVSADYKTNASDLLASSSGEENSFNFQMDNISDTVFERVEEKYYIHRPFKLNVYANFALIPNFIEFTAGAGVGIRNPFAKNQAEVKFYPEYYFASEIGLANIIVFNASTEYTDQLFKHQLGFKLNFRIVEVNVGASLQSASFVSSFKVSGFGAYANLAIGF